MHTFFAFFSGSSGSAGTAGVPFAAAAVGGEALAPSIGACVKANESRNAFAAAVAL